MVHVCCVISAALFCFILNASATAEMANPTPEQIATANQAVIDAGQGGVIYPVAAGVANVRAYGAVGDGQTDDTAAFQAALDAMPRHALIYVPNGTYRITDTLRWGGTSRGNAQKRQVLQGQSQAGVVLRVPDAHPAFADADAPRAVIWTGKAPAQRFMNGIRDVTVDVGASNPGAIGVQFFANNQGAVSRLTIRSSDPDYVGHIGLDLGYSDEQGPCLIEHVTVEGFDTGVSTKHAVDSVTFEHLTLRHQRVVGFKNDGQCIALRKLDAKLNVPIYHNTGPGVTALIDSTLAPADADHTGPAVINDRHASLMLRNVDLPGELSIQHQGDTQPYERTEAGLVQLYVSQSPLTLFDTDLSTLNLAIQETPDIPMEAPNRWANVADFGPPETIQLIEQKTGKAQTRPDWTAAIQRAIDSGATTVYFPALGDFGFYGKVYVRGPVQRITALRNSFPGIVQSTHESTIFQPDTIPHWIIAEGSGPVVIEDFNSHYFLANVVQQSKRPVVVRHMSIANVLTTPESGDVFLTDVRGRHVDAHGSRVFARQLNTEGHTEPRNQARDGGSLWVLGLKTEGDATIAHAKPGGQIEIVGGFIYANKATDPEKVMFRIDQGGALSATVGEWTTKKRQPFAVAEQMQGDTTRRLKHGDAPGRGHGSRVPLFIARPAATQPGM